MKKILYPIVFKTRLRKNERDVVSIVLKLFFLDQKRDRYVIFYAESAERRHLNEYREPEQFNECLILETSVLFSAILLKIKNHNEINLRQNSFDKNIQNYTEL